MPLTMTASARWSLTPRGSRFARFLGSMRLSTNARQVTNTPLGERLSKPS